MGYGYSRRSCDGVGVAMMRMDKATQSFAVVLLGIFTIYLLAQRTSTTFAAVGFGLIVAFSVGRSLWYQTASMYSAAILTCAVMIVLLIVMR